MTTADHKWCPHCRTYKLRAEFSPTCGWCKACARDRRRELRQAPPAGRVCNHEGCETILSSYNKSPDGKCWAHRGKAAHGSTEWTKGRGILTG